MDALELLSVKGQTGSKTWKLNIYKWEKMFVRTKVICLILSQQTGPSCLAPASLCRYWISYSLRCRRTGAILEPFVTAYPVCGITRNTRCKENKEKIANRWIPNLTRVLSCFVCFLFSLYSWKRGWSREKIDKGVSSRLVGVLLWFCTERTKLVRNTKN